MKLILLVEERDDKQGAVVYSCVRPTDEEERFGQVHNNLSQANQVARLTEVAQEVEKVVNAYYSKGHFPRVGKYNGDETPLSGGLILASAEPLNQRTQHAHSSGNE